MSSLNDKRRRVVAMVLAGGQGARLHPLTSHRAKSAVPFGARYRIIDFILNNLVNSGIYSIYVLTQFRAQSLTEHIQRYWRFGAFLTDHFITLVPAQMFRYEELGSSWYRGTADAIYQNLHLIEDYEPAVVAVFGGDHVFKMNISHMVGRHFDSGADMTIAGFPVPIDEACRFGILEVDEKMMLTGFEEKPTKPKPMPGRPGMTLVSMGNYLFRTEALKHILADDAQDPTSSHDFGKDVIPRALRDGLRVQVYDFHDNPIPGQSGPNTYWRDIGTLDAYFDASMDLVQVVPEFDVFNPEWVLRAANTFSPPAKFVHEAPDRTGHAINSLVAGGVIISGALAREAVLFRRVRLHSFALVERSVLFDEVIVGRHARVKNAIIDKDVEIPEGARVGYDLELDRARGFVVTPQGVVVVPKGYRFEG
jgi:glucose-1-phosphate adenylyltransferase